MKKQVVVIHGGDNFETYEEYLDFLKTFDLKLEHLLRSGWKQSLQGKLGTSYQIVKPEMPNSWNARYKEWKIWFEKILNLVDKELILVGHSLGGIFLAKYLSEDKLDKDISGVFLIAAPFDEKDADYKLLDFNLSNDLTRFSDQARQIFLYHSKNDDQVPFSDLGKYAKVLPKAKIRIFQDRGHFNQEEFPELIEDIKSL